MNWPVGRAVSKSRRRVPAQIAKTIGKGQEIIAIASHLLEVVGMAIASAILTFMVAVLFLQVLFRYVLKAPLPWTEEAARFALIWYAMLTAAIAVRGGQQFVFRWATLRLSDTLRLWLTQMVNLGTIVFLWVLFLTSLSYLPLVANQTAPGTHVNMQVAYLALPAGVGFLLVVYLLEVLDAVASVVTGKSFSLREKEEASMRSLLVGGTEALEEMVRAPIEVVGSLVGQWEHDER